MDTADETWTRRDRPTLMAAARLLDHDPGNPQSHRAIATAADLAPEQALRALSALDGTYLECELVTAAEAGVVLAFALGLTERGRRTAGLWPSGDGVEALVDALNQAAETSTDEDDRTWLRRAAGALGQVSRNVTTDVLASVITKQLTG